MAPPEEVYIGVWRNWDKDSWSGSTITLPPSYAVVLVSFIAIFVRLIGSHLWGILCFITHQCLSTPAPRDGLHHQRQVLLRNTSGVTQTLWKLVQLHWQWRGKVDGILKRFLLTAGPTTISFLALAASGLLSSQLMSVGDEALIRSNVCGWLADAQLSTSNTVSPNEDTNIRSDSLFVAGRWSLDKALEHKTACYEPQTAETMVSPLCNRYSRAQLAPMSVNHEAPCPFPVGNCDGSGLATEIDSGFIESSGDLGINTPAEDRVQFRKVTTCAVLKSEKYESEWMPPRPGTGLAPGMADRYLWKYYDLFKDPSITASTGISNETMMWTTMWQLPDYYLGIWSRFEGNSEEALFYTSPDFIDEIVPQSGGDTTYLSLYNMLVYANEVKDAWFRASSQNNSRGLYSPYPGHDIPNAWYPDRVASFLVCTERYQFCAGGHCTPLAGLYEHRPPSPTVNATGLKESSAAYQALGLNERQAAVYSLLWKAVWATRTYFATLFLRNRILLAGRFRHDTLISAAVNPNQWALEAENFHNLSMATLQRRVVEYASPPDVPIRPGQGTRQFIVPPTSEDEMQLCHSIKVRGSEQASFSLPGLLTIIIGGCFVILANTFLPNLVFWVRRRRNPATNGDKTDAWKDDQVFYLQHAALSSQHIGPWETANDTIPVLKDCGKKFVVSSVAVTEVDTEQEKS